jgi:2-oxoglutarate dehydrogenase E1 component
MSTLPVTSVYNDGYIAELFEAYRRDPASVDPSWVPLFRLAESLAGAPAAGAAPSGEAADTGFLRKVAGAAKLQDAIREYGHLAARIDPLGSSPPGAAELTPEFHGITEADLEQVPGVVLGDRFADKPTAADVIAHLRRIYSGRVGYEYTHLSNEVEREWFREQLRPGGETLRALDADEKKAVLRRLTQVDGLERYIGRAWVNMKRFSIEGTDALVPMLDTAIAESSRLGAADVVIGMAHRGRINVLAHILDKPYAAIFGEFDGQHAHASAESETGDVKYHLGARTERDMGDGKRVRVTLVPNPSHLEVVNPVLEGFARALQRVDGESVERDEARVLPVLVHGDAAFPGEGVVSETLNLSALAGYGTGGTLHVIANNQVGFTTDPNEGRSTYYASDLAKGFEIPIVHVNADDAESCIAAVRLAIAYRARFEKDFLIDLVGYRRHGHNEGDEPTFTQPQLYAAIKAHPTPRQVWGDRLVAEGIATADEVQAIDREIAQELERINDERKARGEEDHDTGEHKAAAPPASPDTAVRAEQLIALNERLLAWPSDFSPHQRLAKQLERRRDAMGEQGGIDWGHAESLAFASLLSEGTSVRLTGQDAERGTFSHRHAVLHDVKTGAKYAPLAHLARQGEGTRASFEIYNSPLSEMAVLAFEYGYSVASPETLTLWEAQFGDFVNVAQPIIDQFLAADRAKWGQDSGVVLLLPHGYEGQGPEHSSARLERFLQLSAEGNMRVAYPSTPAQYFHILRRQAQLEQHRPLILMQPKSLLRLPTAASRLDELASGRFRATIDDAQASARRDAVRRLVCCSGKIYYDLLAARGDAAQGSGGPEVALARVEELYPWPHEEVARIVDAYPNLEEVVWAQEEPKNMGAWSYVAPRLRASTGNQMVIRYIGRPERASPAEGYIQTHQAEQARIVGEALDLSRLPSRRREALR